MQNLQTIKVALDQIQQRIDAALALAARDSDNIHGHEMGMKLREARAAMLRAQSRMRTVMNDSNPNLSEASPPAPPSVDVSPGSKAGRRWAYCDRCREHIRRDQLGAHMWQMHRADIDGRMTDMARVAAELQQRDNDLYRDD
jgi:hypothetical protein